MPEQQPPKELTKPDKPYLSPSRLNMFGRCAEQYRRRYVEGEIIPPGIKMLRGTGVHGAAKLNFEQKIESCRDLPEREIVDCAVSQFDVEIQAGGVTLTEEEERTGIQRVIGQARDDVADFARVLAADQCPDYQPIWVERWVRKTLRGPRDLVGIIDIFDNKSRVTDLKTAGKRKSQFDADVSIQLTTYAVLAAEVTGEFPAEVRLDTAVVTKTKSYRDLKASKRTSADLIALANRITEVSRSIDAGIFPPTCADPPAWWCGPDYCGYYRTCKHVNGNLVKLRT